MSQKIELEVTLDSNGAIKGIKGITSETEKFGNQTDKTTQKLQSQQKAVEANTFSFKNLATAAAGLFAAWQGKQFFSESITEAIESQKAYAMLEKALNGAGGAYTQTVNQLKDFSNALMWTTGVEDETTAAVMRQLIQFKIAPSILERTTEAVISYGKATGDGVVTQQSAIDIAKKFALALEHPETALRGLRDAGIVFNQSQRKTINEMVATGDAAKVQDAILRQLETTYAAKGPETYAGQIKKIKIAFGELQESFGTGLLKGIEGSGLFKSAFEGLKTDAIQEKFQAMGESIGKSFGDIAKIVVDNMGNIVDAVEVVSDTVTGLANGFRAVLSPVKGIFDGILNLTGGFKNLAIAAGTFFAISKFQTILSGFTILNSSLTTLYSSMMTAVAGMSACGGSMGVLSNASNLLARSITGLGAALSNLALPGLAAAVMWLSSKLDDLNDAQDRVLASQQEYLATQMEVINYYRAFQKEAKISEQSLRWIEIGFRDIEDPAQRYLEIMKAIGSGDYGEKLAQDIKNFASSYKSVDDYKAKINEISEADKRRRQEAEAARQAHVKEIQAAIEGLEKELGISEKAGKNLVDRVKEINTIYEKHSEIIAGSYDINDKFRKKVDELTESFENQKQKIPASIQRIKQATEENTAVQLEYASAMRDIAFEMTGYYELIGKTDEQIAEMVRQGELAKQSTDEYAEAIGILTGKQLTDLEIRIKSVTSVFDDNRESILNNYNQFENFKKIVDELTTKMTTAGTKIPESWQSIGTEINETERKINAVNIAIAMMTGTLELVPVDDATGEFKDFNTALEATIDDLYTVVDAAQNVADGLEDLGIVSGETAKTLNTVFSGVNQAIGGVENTIKGISSGNILKTINGITSAFAGLAKAIASIFKSKGDIQALRRDFEGLPGLTEDWASKLRKAAEDLKGMGSAGRVVNEVFDQIIESSELTVKNFGVWTERLRNIFSLFTQGLQGGKETADDFGRAFEAILKESRRLGIEGGKDMTGLILMFDEMKEKGVVVTEILQYIQEETKEGAAGYKKMFDSLDTTELQAKIDELRMKIAFGTEDGNFDRGMGILDLEKLNAEMAKMNEFKNVFKSAVIGSFDEQLAFEKKIAANKNFTDAIDGWSVALEKKTNTGRLSLEEFIGAEQTAAAEMAKLGELGFSEKESFKMLAPQLQRILMLSEQFPESFKLDETTKALIEQGKALGLITETQKEVKTEQEVMGSGFKTVSDALFLLIETLGGKVPEAMRKASANILDFADDAKDASTQNVTVEMNTNAVDTAAGSMSSKFELIDSVAKKSTDSMSRNFDLFKNSVDGVTQSIIDLELKMNSLGNVPVYGVKESVSGNPKKSIEILQGQSVQPVNKSSMEIMVKVDGQSGSGSNSNSAATELARAIIQATQKNRPLTEYELSQVIVKMLQNNINGIVGKVAKILKPELGL